VGLLLVTKLLPAGDEQVVRAVAKAVSSQFLVRLLLPLHPRFQVCALFFRARAQAGTQDPDRYDAN
jgi:hypothetical protein